MSNPVVSVVMSVFNGQKYLQPAIDSVLQQTFADFEFLIADDGSVDNSWDILRAYAAADRRVRVWRNEANFGVAGSINRLLVQVQGSYITRHDADDLSLADKLAEQVAYFDSHPAIGLLATRVAIINGESQPVTDFEFFTRETANDPLQRQLLEDCHICQGSVMFGRQLLNKAGLYDAGLVPTEDYDLWLRMAEITQMACLDRVLYQYRIHAGGQSRTHFPQQLYAKAIALDRAVQRRGLTDHLQHRNRVARFYLEAALAKYDADEPVAGRASLNRAVQLTPFALQIENRFLDLLVDYTSRCSLEAGLELVRVVSADAPATRHTAQVISRVRSLLYMREVFAHAGQRAVEGIDLPLWQGLRHDRRWLLNRGVLSILARLLFLKFRGLRQPAESLDRKNSSEG